MTDQHLSDDALRTSERRRRLALDSAELGAWHVDPATMTLTTDERFRAIFGVTADRLDYEQAVAVIHPDDRDRVRDAVAAATRPENPAPYAVEYRVVRPGGAVRWVFAKGRANFEDSGTGRRLGSFDGTLADVTDRKRAEDERERLLREVETERTRLAEVFRLAPSFMCVLRGPDHVFERANDRYYQLVGHREVTGKTVREALPEVEGQGFFELLDAVYRTGEPFVGTNLPVLLQRSPGDPPEERFMDLVYQAVRGPEGTISGVFAQGIDVTAQKTANDALRQLAADLSATSRQKDEFLATLAHELRNPLAPIRNGLTILARDAQGGDRGTLVGMMERQLGQLVHLVDDLLDVSRVTTGKVTLRRERVAVQSVLAAAVETSRPLVEQAGHELRLRTPDEPLVVDGDPTRLAQVVTNLLNNAAKYTPPGGRIELSAAAEGGEAVVRVADDGVGIPADMLPKVFDLFTQVGRSLDRAQGGLGIGLSLVRKLVEMHGGSATADSAGPGRGSTFVVRLPLAGEQPAQPTPAAGPGGSRPATVTRRILVVDDNVDGAESLAMLLSIGGHTATTAYSGPDAVAAAVRTRPDVVFLDIGLPGMNGYEVAERLRNDPALPRPVLVALTGWASEDDRKRATAAGFDYHLTKPVEAGRVADLLAQL